LKVHVGCFGNFSENTSYSPHIDLGIILDFVENDLRWSIPSSRNELGQLTVLSAFTLSSLVNERIGDLFFSVSCQTKG
jgi:hypothetical protein